MSYWENEEIRSSDNDQMLSPVYSLAVQSQALWLLSGTELGGINLQSVRHDEGKKIHCLKQHTHAVSVLTLAPDETSVLSGSWDKTILDWDLNTGHVIRKFDGMGGQISAIELRPEGGDAIPVVEDEPVVPTGTISTNNGAPPANGSFSDTLFGGPDAPGQDSLFENEGQNSPAHESLFGGGSDDAGSLFGETNGDQPFGNDEDDYNNEMGMNMMNAGQGNDDGMDHSADMAMAGMDGPGQQQASGAMYVDSKTQPSNDTAASPKAEASQNTQPSDMSQDQLKVAAELKHEDGSEQGADAPSSPKYVHQDHPSTGDDPSLMSRDIFLSAAIDGSIRIWDRRVPNPVAKIGTRVGVPPWCMSACWSPSGNLIYAGRRNGTVEEFDVRKARRGWEPERTLKFPAGSGAVSAVKPMMNGRHLVW